MSSFENDEDRIADPLPRADHFYVVPLDDDTPVREDMAWMLQHMAERRGGAAMNRRRDVSPAALRTYLPRITLLEPVYDDDSQVVDARYRLMGTEISALYGEATGQLISDYHGDRIRDRVCRISNACIGSKGPMLGLSKALSGGHHYMDVSVLYFPLSEDGEVVQQFLVYSAVERARVSHF